MIYRTTLLIIKIFDYFHKKKIISFLKKNKKSEINTIIDVGGHTGESIDLFLKNFSVKKIISFEASPINFKKLETNCISLKKKYIHIYTFFFYFCSLILVSFPQTNLTAKILLFMM